MYQKNQDAQRKTNISYDLQPVKQIINLSNQKDLYYIDQGDQFQEMNDCANFMIPIQPQSQSLQQQFNFAYYQTPQTCGMEKNQHQTISFQPVVIGQFPNLPIALNIQTQGPQQYIPQAPFQIQPTDIENPIMIPYNFQQPQQAQSNLKPYVRGTNNSNPHQIIPNINFGDPYDQFQQNNQISQTASQQQQIVNIQQQERKSASSTRKGFSKTNICKKIKKSIKVEEKAQIPTQVYQVQQPMINQRLDNSEENNKKDKQEEFNDGNEYSNYRQDEQQKILFDNTLTGYVLKTFAKHRQVPLTESYVVEQVRANMHKLKRPDGTKYKGNIYKTVKGSLTSNGIFQKVISEGNESQWIVNKEAASEFEKRTVQRFQHLADKRKMLKKQRNFRCVSPDSEALPRTTEQLQDSNSYQLIQPVIENKFRHVYSLLDGFITSQKDNQHLKSILDQVQIQDVETTNEYDQFTITLQEYNIKEVLQGIKEAYSFFSELIVQKVEEYELNNQN